MFKLQTMSTRTNAPQTNTLWSTPILLACEQPTPSRMIHPLKSRRSTMPSKTKLGALAHLFLGQYKHRAADTAPRGMQHCMWSPAPARKCEYVSGRNCENHSQHTGPEILFWGPEGGPKRGPTFWARNGFKSAKPQHGVSLFGGRNCDHKTGLVLGPQKGCMWKGAHMTAMGY